MDQTIHTLGDYLGRLEERELLCAPVPGGLDPVFV